MEKEDLREKDFYTVVQLEKILPLSKSSLYKLVNREDFPKFKYGRKILIPAKEFREYMKSNTVG